MAAAQAPFGGIQTERKLDAMRWYFESYVQALKETYFARVYVDAFAGTGSWTPSGGEEEQGDMLDETTHGSELKKGSARIALEIMPPFDRYLFIESSASKARELGSLIDEYGGRRIDVVQRDANAALVDFARTTDWAKCRAAVFIDPFGLQVDWTTLEALSVTKADIVLLFPTSGIGRVTPHDGNMQEGWEERLDRHLGTREWRDAFYREAIKEDLFEGSIVETRRDIDIDGLREFALERLCELFAHVCHRQAVLTDGKIVFHLFFICANESSRAGEIAMRIARGVVRRSEREWSRHGR